MGKLKSSSLWVIVLFVSIAIVDLQGELVMQNGTIGQASEVLPVGNDAVKPNDTYYNEAKNNNRSSYYRGGGGGGGGGGGVRHNGRSDKNRFSKDDYKIGEFAQCTRSGRCRGMRLDCPLHCGGPCYYDCQYMCKAHCQRPKP